MFDELTHCSLVMQTASENLVIIGSGNGLAPIWCQAITFTNDDLSSVEPLQRKCTLIKFKYNNSAFGNEFQKY